MGVLHEMKVIPHLEEVLVDNNHLTIKDQKLLEEERQMDHLMEILEIMDPQVMEDILQDKDHQEEADLQEIKDLQAPLDHKDLWDHKVHLDKS